MVPELAGLPGAERVAAGVRDLDAGRLTPDALLVSIASARLGELGIPLAPGPPDPELALYAALDGSVEDPYFHYGALLRELDSFLAALEARHRRAERRGDAAGAPAATGAPSTRTPHSPEDR